MKILMVLTSHDQLGNTGRKTGFWLEEFAAPYFVFRDAGVELTLASPKGGQPPIDPKSDLPENQTPAVARFKKDPAAQKALLQTVKLADMKAEDFDTIFYVGGHGPMWDLVDNPDSIALIESFYNSGKPVAAVCHSSAVFHRVTYQGAPMVKDKRMTGFTNGEEEAVHLAKVVPFLVEDELKRVGARYEKAAGWESFAITDGRLVTGQNPASSPAAAHALLKMLAQNATDTPAKEMALHFVEKHFLEVNTMSGPRKTAIVTGASRGIGAGIVKAFVERDFNIVANSRKMTQSAEVTASDRVALVDGHIGEPATAVAIVETALSRFQSIDALVNNAGIFFIKPFTDYSAEDFKSLVSTNLEGFLYVTQMAVKQMLAQKTGGSIVTITAALARNPDRGVTAAVPMLTKGGLETITRHLAMEYANDGIRVNAVAPGVVYTPLHRDTPKDVMESLSPMGRPSTIKDIADAVMYLTDAATVTGDVLHVDGGSHCGRW